MPQPINTLIWEGGKKNVKKKDGLNNKTLDQHLPLEQGKKGSQNLLPF